MNFRNIELRIKLLAVNNYNDLVSKQEYCHKSQTKRDEYLLLLTTKEQTHFDIIPE